MRSTPAISGLLIRNAASIHCRNFSRAYLRHLFKAEEVLALRLATIHNLYFLLDFMRRMRQAIIEDRFLSFRDDFWHMYEKR